MTLYRSGLVVRAVGTHTHTQTDRQTAELKNTSLLLILLSSTISKTMLWQPAIVSIAWTWNFVNTLLCIYVSFCHFIMVCYNAVRFSDCKSEINHELRRTVVRELDAMLPKTVV